MICEGSGFPEGDSANAPDFITGRFHDRTYAKKIIILENYTVNHTGSRQGPGSGGTSFQSPAAPSTPALPTVYCVLFSVGSLQVGLRLLPSKRTCIRQAPPPARVPLHR